MRCPVCAKQTHAFCQARLWPVVQEEPREQEEMMEMEEPAQELSCRMCEAKAATPDHSTLQLVTTVLASVKLETEQRIGVSQKRQRLGLLEKVKLELRVAELEAERVEGMGEMEKKLDAAMTDDVRAFRQTFLGHQMTGYGIGRMLEKESIESLVKVFAGTEWAETYRAFLTNYSIYHHFAMSQRPLGDSGQARLELVVRNLSIVLATKFQTRITPKMDVLLTQVQG